MILLTGASRGIGFACARDLLERTAHRVTITGRSAERLDFARSTLPPALRRRLQTRVCDQSDAVQVEALCRFISDPEEPLHGAILGVGVNPVHIDGPRRMHLLDPDTVRTTLTTNCTHAMLLTAGLLAQFSRQREGTLVWIGSQGWRHGPPGSAVYSASKSFLSGVARVARNEYAGRGIRVHLVHPGLVRTDRTSDVADALAARHGVHVDSPAEVARRIVDILLDGSTGDVEVDL